MRGRPKSLTGVERILVKARYWLGADTQDLADRYSVSRGTVYKVIRGEY